DGPRLDQKLLNLVVHNLINVEGHGAFKRFAQSSRSHTPLRGEPARGALQPHPELRQARPIRGNLGRPEGSRVVFLMDTGGVVANGPAAAIVIKLDRHTYCGDPDLPKLLPVVEEALQRVVNELRHRVPRLVLQVPEHRQDADARTDAYSLIGAQRLGLTQHG